MNAMLYVRGRPLDYDLWEAQGAAGWGWEDVRPYFLRAEDNERGASEHHAVGGPLHVADERSPRPLTRALPAGRRQAAGIPVIADYNGPEQDGAALAQVTQTRRPALEHGRRLPAPGAGPREPRGRHRRARRSASSLEGDRAVGVRCRDRRGREQVARPSARSSWPRAPSGRRSCYALRHRAGRRTCARSASTVRHDLPGVGENLQDHPYVVCIWEATGGSLYGADKPKPLLEWLLRRSGPADLDRRRGVRLRPQPPGPARAPTCSSTSPPAYFDDNGFEEYDGHAFTLRAGAHHAAQPRARAPALGRPGGASRGS